MFSCVDVVMLLVVVPVAIPGAGKSSVLTRVFRNLRAKDKYLQDVRQINRDNHAQLSSVTLVGSDATGLIGDRAASAMRHLMNAVSSRAVRGGSHVLLIDKNHSLGSLESSLGIFENAPFPVNALIVNFCPTRKVTDDWRYPFPVEYILGCLSRLLERHDHPTLPSSSPSLIPVFLDILRGHRKRAQSTFHKVRLNCMRFDPFVNSASAEKAVLERDYSCLSDFAKSLQLHDDDSMFDDCAETLENAIYRSLIPRKTPLYYALDVSRYKRMITELTGFTCPSDAHITIAYYGRKNPLGLAACEREALHHKLLNNSFKFSMDQLYHLPGRIACISVRVHGIDSQLIQQRPHITLWCKPPYKAIDSNQLLKGNAQAEITNLETTSLLEGRLKAYFR